MVCLLALPNLLLNPMLNPVLNNLVMKKRVLYCQPAGSDPFYHRDD